MEPEGNAPNTSEIVEAPVKKPRWKEFLIQHKKVLVIAGSVIVLLIVVGLAAWFAVPKKAAAPTTVKTATKSSAPTTVADPLTGMMVSSSAASEPITGVMIENLYPDARPQSGLSQAGVVYEALAEGGITRFLAIFQEPFPSTIGPVRSLRPYYLDWGLEYNIPVVHAGGSEPALAAIGPSGLKNIDALSYDGSYFYRTTDRVAPHNLYTSDTLLSKLLIKLNFAAAPSFTPVARKDDTPPTAAAPAAHTDIKITYGANANYNVEYTYDPVTNSYDRLDGGTAAIDRNTNAQILVKNVVVEFAPVSYGTQQDGKPETDYNLIGTGTAYVFQDGSMITGTWSKATASGQTQILDSTGTAVKFDRGNIWYEVVPTGNSVTD